MTSQADRQLEAADARRLAAARAARAAAASRRAAAAKRRLALTVGLLLVAGGAWAGFALLSWPVVAPIVATIAFVGVLALGRSAAAAGAAADARWEQELAGMAARAKPSTAEPGGGQRKLRVDVDPTSLMATGEIPTLATPSQPDVNATTPGAWTPIPVPPPAYTLKQTAPRRTVSPLVMEAQTEQMDAVLDQPVAPAAGEDVAEEAAAPSLDLQAVLARRRAVS